jgi:outer membrane protein assembly factor BamB
MHFTTLTTRVTLITLNMVVLGAMSGASRAQDWNQYGGPNRNFQVDVTSEIASQVQSEPSSLSLPAWRVPVQGGDDTPLVLGDRIVLSEMDVADDGTDAHRLTCRRWTDGSLLWEKSYPERSFPSQDISDKYPVRPLASALSAEGRLVSVGYGGSVRCVRIDDGSLLWEHDLVEAFGASPIQYGAASAPWSDPLGENVVVACGGDRALLIAFRWKDGSVAWMSGQGVASYAALVELNVPGRFANEPATKQLVYAAGNAIVGFQPSTGVLLWTYDYPKQGLTNAVTPLAIGPGQLLVAGQGIGGSALIEVSRNAQDGFTLREVWRNDRINPFYCNWVHVPDSNMVVGFAGKTLFGMDVGTGKTLWQKRGWTDSNVTLVGSSLYVLRGDGMLAKTSVSPEGIEILNAENVVQDRIWSPMIALRGRYLVRGRNRLVSGPIDALPTSDSLPEGTSVTSMDAMYGEPNERMTELRERAKGNPAPLTWSEYQTLADDASLPWEDGVYRGIVQSLIDRADLELAGRIAEDWGRRFPQSIAAFEFQIDVLERQGSSSATALRQSERMVEVTFDFAVPASTPTDATVYVTGNASSLGNWKPDGLLLVRQTDARYHGTALLPKGDLQYKLTLGSKETFEMRADQRNISNRRQRVRGPLIVRGEVQAWKSADQ